MARSWKKLDLGGGGLQSANLVLVQRLKRRGRAYAWWLLFPLGAHRFYLNESGAWLYPVATGAALLLAQNYPAAAWVVGVLLLAAGLYDLLRIDRRVTEINKRIRMETYLRPGNTMPPDFRGRFGDDKDEQRPEGARQAGRPPSFSQQEARLRQLAQQQRRKKPNDD